MIDPKRLTAYQVFLMSLPILMPIVPAVFFIAFHDTKAVEVIFGGWRFLLVIAAFVALGAYLSRKLLEIEESKPDPDRSEI